MRALGYFRLDAATQTDGAWKAVHDYEEDFAEYCLLNLHQQIQTFGDIGPSEDGSYAEYIRLLEYIRESGSNFLVAIPDASHLGSDIETVARSFIELETTGSKVTCQDENIPDPLQSALTILGVSGESRDRVSKIRAAMQNRAVMGKAMGRAAYGYRNGDDGTLVVVEDEAEVVRLIFNLYTEERLGIRRIVQRLNGRDIRTRRGGRWSVVTIHDILKNPVYIGTYMRFGLRLPRAHEAIVNSDTYRAARDIVRERRPRVGLPRAEPYLLSGIAFCGYCGNKMMGVTRRQQWRKKDGERVRNTYRYYQCQSRNNQSVCGYHTWRESELEEAVVAQIRSTIENVTLGSDGFDSANNKASEALTEVHREELKNAERRFIQAMKKTATGASDTDLLEGAINDVDRARARAASAATVPDAPASVAIWEYLGFDQKRDFLLAHVTRVEVSDQTARVVV
jgi:DNA invertase Pin-like site-specific DNA recombinase